MYIYVTMRNMIPLLLGHMNILLTENYTSFDFRSGYPPYSQPIRHEMEIAKNKSQRTNSPETVFNFIFLRALRLYCHLSRSSGRNGRILAENEMLRSL